MFSSSGPAAPTWRRLTAANETPYQDEVCVDGNVTVAVTLP